MIRLRRIYWKPDSLPEDRQACAAWLRACGLLPVPMINNRGGRAIGVWAIRRAGQ